MELLKLMCCPKLESCHSLIAAAINPEMVDMLPYVRGQGVMDLEFERDGGCGTLVCLFPFLTTPPALVFPLILPFLFSSSSLPPSLPFHPVSTPPAHRHEVTYVTTHKGPSPAAIFSHDSTSVFLFTSLSSGRLAATASADSSIKVSDFSMSQ